MVAAGAVVTRDVAAYSLVVGTPARWLRWICVCGGRLDTSLACDCGRTYRFISDQQGLELAVKEPAAP